MLTLWLWPSIFGGKVLLPLDILANNAPHTSTTDGQVHNHLLGDMVWENYAWKLHQRECFLNGELPLWNANTFCGHPLFATGQTATFYPLNLIFIAMPPAYAYAVFTGIHLLLGGVFMYLFLRRIGAGDYGATAGGVMFGLSSFFVYRLIWPMLLGSGIWLPLMLLWIYVISDERPLRTKLHWLALGPVLFAQPILSGFLEIAFYVFTAAGLYTLVRGIKLAVRDRSAGRTLAFLAGVGGATAMAVALSAPQLLPFLDVVPRNVRAGEQTYDDLKTKAFEPIESLVFIAPDAFGNPAVHRHFDLHKKEFEPIDNRHGQDWYYFGPKNYVEVAFYFGLLPLLLLVISLTGRGNEKTYFWLLLALALALAFVTPVYRLFFEYVPGAAQVRSPHRWIFLALFAGSCLAAIGAEQWHRHLTASASKIGRLAGGTLVRLFVAFGLLLLLAFMIPNTLDDLAGRIMRGYDRAAQTFQDDHQLAGWIWTVTLRFWLFGLAAAIVVALAYSREWSPRGARLVGWAALGLIAVDLGQASYSFNTHSETNLLDKTPEVALHLQTELEESPQPFRIARYGSKKIFYPNSPTFYGLQDYGGYDSIILTDYANFLQAIESQKLLPYNIVMTFEEAKSLDSPLIPLLGVRYLLSADEIDHPNWQFVMSDGVVNLYRLSPDLELPRAFLVGNVRQVDSLDEAIGILTNTDFDPTTTAVSMTKARPTQAGEGNVSIESYGHTTVSLNVEAETDQLLVLQDVMYPGWNAYINGERVEKIHTVNGIFRGVHVPTGTHQVIFRFEPPSLRTGFILSGTCSIAILILLVAALWLAPTASKPKRAS